jgi:two-component system sensor histidine kinase VicK
MEDSTSRILKDMTDRSDEMFFIFNPNDRRFVYASPAFETIVQKSNNDLFNNAALLYDTIHPEDRKYVKENFLHLLTKKTSSLLDFRIQRPDNVERWIRLKVYPIIDNGEIKYLSGIVEDDSARKASIFNMEKINGWKDSILEILSHDLRGPIGIVKLLASAIAGKLPKTEYQQIHEWTTTIQNISQRNINLIRTLLSKESLDTVGVETSKERVDLVWEINEIMHIFNHSKNEINKQFLFTHSQPAIFA